MDSINNACKFGSDAWLELQAFKTRQLNRREKLNRHKNLHKDLIDGIASNHQPPSGTNPNGPTTSSSSSASLNNSTTTIANNNLLSSYPSTSTNKAIQDVSSANPIESSRLIRESTTLPDPGGEEDRCSKSFSNNNNNNNNNNNISGKFVASNVESPPTTQVGNCREILRTGASSSSSSSEIALDRNVGVDLKLVECFLLLKLCDVALKLPIDSRSLQRSICKIRGLETTPQPLVENLLQKFAHQELITIDEPAAALLARGKKQSIHHARSSNAHGDNLVDDEACIYVTSADHTKLVEFDKSFGSLNNIRALLIEPSKGVVEGDSLGGDECDLSSSVPIQNVRTVLSNSSTATSNDQHHRHSSNDDSTSDNYSTDAKHHNRQLDTSNIINELDHKSNSSSIIASPHFKNTNSTNLSNTKKQSSTNKGDDLESLLSLSSTKERESKKLGEELLELLSKPTAKERNLLERFRSADGYQVQEFCPKGTKGECNRNNKGAGACDKLHFKKIIAKHTEESLGDCSFLNTCFHMDSCKYVHYEVDYDQKQPQQQQHQFKRPHPAESLNNKQRTINNDNISTPTDQQAQQIKSDTIAKTDASKINNISNNNKVPAICLPGPSNSATKYTLSPEEQARIDAKNRKRFKTVLYPPQWIQCDLRFFDMSLLGKFSVVMADPPWDIHMELPYGTMSDDEMRKLNIPALQDEGVIFLWVTGRAMELGRECLALWGYERCDEIIWVKTNQLQRIIRTGRTGHWLNHGKEHCLVGVKGNPKDINRGLDCDVIVAEVRATSHKPDEIYGIIERLSPGTRKIELFGRAHNVQPNWITLGNQLNGVRLIEPSLVNAFKKLNLPFQTAADNVA